MFLSLRGHETKDLSQLQALLDIYGIGGSKSGMRVDWRTALQVSTFLACARVIANGLAQVPLKLMRLDVDTKKRTEARDHPLYDVLNRRTNMWQTSFEFRETLGLHLTTFNNAYCFKNVVQGQITELIPFEPNRVETKCDEYGTLTYKVHAASGATLQFPSESIWHIKGPSWGGWIGMNPVDLAREAIGLALVTEDAHARLHSNGANTGGTYSIEGKLDTKQYNELRDWIEKNHVGPENRNRPLILDRNAKWLQTQMTGVDAQHLETRRFQIEEVCRGCGVMPIMIGYSDKTATFASAEQFFLAHVVHTMSPHWTRIEQSIDANLLTDRDASDGIYSNFVEEGLLRGSIKDTMDVLLGYVNGGVMTANEGRAKLDLDPDDDPESDELRIPVNIAGAVPEPAEDPAAKSLRDAMLHFLKREPAIPVVNVAPAAIHIEAAPAPVVNVAAPIVNVQRTGVKEIKIHQRDADGFISHATQTEH